jgi:hypothetical protein
VNLLRGALAHCYTKFRFISERRSTNGTASLSGLEGFGLPELLVLIKRTAEWARNRRVLNPREAMVPDEVKEAKVLYARARAWPLGEPLRRAEPKWQKPGDVEAAFFALYDALRSKMWLRAPP